MTDKAALIWDEKGLRITDTGGIVVFEMAMGTSDPSGDGSGSRSEKADWLYKARTECVDCGTRIPFGSIYCKMDAPYGFWHWARFFAPWVGSRGRIAAAWSDVFRPGRSPRFPGQ